MIYNDLNQLLEAFKPNVVVMERLFFAKNQTTFIAVGKSTGVMQLAAAQKGIEVVEYTPPEIKQAVTGEGNAEKHQVQYMIQRILSIKEIPKPDDAADALAICICHAHSERLKNAK
jgi:crossover junction endodeoxyribonuclease RuvC